MNNHPSSSMQVFHKDYVLNRELEDYGWEMEEMICEQIEYSPVVNEVFKDTQGNYWFLDDQGHWCFTNRAPGGHTFMAEDEFRDWCNIVNTFGPLYYAGNRETTPKRFWAR
jgi:hypothetical protein